MPLVVSMTSQVILVFSISLVLPAQGIQDLRISQALAEHTERNPEKGHNLKDMDGNKKRTTGIGEATAAKII